MKPPHRASRSAKRWFAADFVEGEGGPGKTDGRAKGARAKRKRSTGDQSIDRSRSSSTTSSRPKRKPGARLVVVINDSSSEDDEQSGSDDDEHDDDDDDDDFDFAGLTHFGKEEERGQQPEGVYTYQQPFLRPLTPSPSPPPVVPRPRPRPRVYVEATPPPGIAVPDLERRANAEDGDGDDFLPETQVQQNDKEELEAVQAEVQKALDSCAQLEMLVDRADSLARVAEFGIRSKNLSAVEEDANALARDVSVLIQGIMQQVESVERKSKIQSAPARQGFAPVMALTRQASVRAHNLGETGRDNLDRIGRALAEIRSWSSRSSSPSVYESADEPVEEDEEGTNESAHRTGEPVAESFVTAQAQAQSASNDAAELESHLRQTTAQANTQQSDIREDGHIDPRRQAAAQTLDAQAVSTSTDPLFVSSKPVDGSVRPPLAIFVPLTMESRDRLVEVIRNGGGRSCNRLEQCDVVIIDEYHPHSSAKTMSAALACTPPKAVVKRNWVEMSAALGTLLDLQDKQYAPEIALSDVPQRLAVYDPPTYAKRFPPGKGGEARISFSLLDKDNIVNHLAVTEASWHGKLCAIELEKRFGRHTWMSYQSHLRDNLEKGLGYAHLVKSFRRRVGENVLQAMKRTYVAECPRVSLVEAEQER